MSSAPTTAPAIDPVAFRAFERAAHSSKAGSYNGLFAAVTNRANEPLLDAAQVRAGTRVLDVAAGPGHLTGAAAARGADAIGTDLAPAMVALARELYPGIRFEEASADALPFADGAFDAVLCAFGMGHFPEAERVAAEFARVLAPGGIVAISWWEGFTRNRINGIFHEVIGRLAKSVPGTVPVGPPMDRFSDPVRFADLLSATGFDDAKVTSVSFTHHLRDADALWDLAMGSFARASATIGAQDETVRRQIRAEVARAAQRYAGTDGLDIPVAFLIASGTKR